jgi:hypothetical protein
MATNVIGPTRCAMSRNEDTGSHPKTDEILVGNNRVSEVCRHCGVEVSNRPATVKLEEPAAAPRNLIVEG